MHSEVSSFIKQVRWKHPFHFLNKKVVEIGSLDINGSPRKYFYRCSYTGVDIGKGKGVDVVCNAHEYAHHRGYKYDTTISTEMLEHDKYWELSLMKMYENTESGGIMIITCAAPNREPHGVTWSKDPESSPFTNGYYRNISIEDFASILPANKFNEYYIKYGRGQKDLYFYGIKK